MPQPWREVVHSEMHTRSKRKSIRVRRPGDPDYSAYWMLTLSCGHFASRGARGFAPRKVRCILCPEEGGDRE